MGAANDEIINKHGNKDDIHICDLDSETSENNSSYSVENDDIVSEDNHGLY